MKVLRVIGLYLSDFFNLFFPSEEWLRQGEQEFEEARRKHEEEVRGRGLVYSLLSTTVPNTASVRKASGTPPRMWRSMTTSSMYWAAPPHGSAGYPANSHHGVSDAYTWWCMIVRSASSLLMTLVAAALFNLPAAAQRDVDTVAETGGSRTRASRFMNATSISYGAGIGNYTVTATRTGAEAISTNQDHYLRFETVNGLEVMNGSASVGVGIGIEYYPGPANGSVIGGGTDSYGQLPLFVDIRIYPGAGKVSPTVIAQAGYSFSVIPVRIPRTEFPSQQITVLAQDVKLNGMEIAVGAGFLYRFSGKVAAHFNVLYDYQRDAYDLMLLYGQAPATSNHNIRSGSLRFSTGLTF